MVLSWRWTVPRWKKANEIPPAQFDSNLKDMQDEVDTIRERFDALPDATEKEAKDE
jgi:hypothetical protein